MLVLFKPEGIAGIFTGIAARERKLPYFGSLVEVEMAYDQKQLSLQAPITLREPAERALVLQLLGFEGVEALGGTDPAVCLDDRGQLIGRRTVHDHAVDTEVELAQHPLGAAFRRTGGCRLQPRRQASV